MRNNLTDFTNENEQNDSTFKLSPICQTNCKTCNSPHLLEIHSLRLEKKLNFRELSEKLKKKYNEDISHSGLAGHFRHYHDYLKRRVEEKMIIYLDKEIDQRGQHSAKLTTLVNGMFEKIADNWQSITPTIENLEKLLKLRYLVMEGKIGLGDYDEQIKVIIENAENVDARQLTLFGPRAESDIVEAKTENTV